MSDRTKIKLSRNGLITRAALRPEASHYLSLRTSTPGPESELVSDFLMRARVEVANGHSVTVLREPQIATNIPDLLVLVWDKHALRKRILLGPLAKKHWTILYQLSQSAPIELEMLSVALRRDVKRELHYLRSLGLVTSYRQRWNIQSVPNTMIIADVIAFEAKIDRPKEALLQAFANTWYASRAYALLPSTTTRTDALRIAARNLNVGIWFHGVADAKMEFHPRRLSPRRSYAAWQLNEWLIAYASAGASQTNAH